MRIIIGALCLIVLLTPVAIAENRYSLAETDGGTVRLDRKTGTVSFCRKVGVALACSMAAEERAAMEKSQEELVARIDELEERLTKLELAKVEEEQRRENSSTSRKSKDLPKIDDQKLSQNDERQIDKALAVAENVMRRFIGVLKDIKRDFETN